ncbi:MAG: helix-turn-helix transcriptional regulator [Clostridia bacterium]|nr:helix-turn-helix transcriptional regulator [Clostridia bacterium]
MNRIKDLRSEKDISQEELGKLIGVTPQGMGLIENEKRKLDTKIASVLADFFNVSVDYLLGKTDVKDKGRTIDEVLNEAMIGMSKEEYDKLSETQKKQIRDFAIFVKNQNEGDKK